MEKLFEKNPPVTEPAADASIASAVKDPISVTPVEYQVHETPGVRIEWTRRGNDYVYQFKPRRPPSFDDEGVCSLLAITCDPLLPRGTQVYFSLPVPEMKVDFYTIRVEDIAGRLGAKEMLENRLLEALGKLDLWPAR